MRGVAGSTVIAQAAVVDSVMSAVYVSLTSQRSRAGTNCSLRPFRTSRGLFADGRGSLALRLDRLRIVPTQPPVL